MEINLDGTFSKKVLDLPPNLRTGLKNIEEGRAIPLFIPTALEEFLTEIGLYESSMTPEQAWQV